MALDIPKFSSEAEEAEWWYEHRDEVEQQFLEAAREGRLRRGSTVLERLRMRQQGVLTVPLSKEQMAKLHELAQQRGIEDAAYAQELLTQALDREAR